MVWLNVQVANSVTFYISVLNDLQVIVQIRVGRLPLTFLPLQTRREMENTRQRRVFFNELFLCFVIGESPTQEYFNALLKLFPIGRKSLGEIWRNLCNFFVRFPNILHGIDFPCFWYIDYSFIKFD